jgi:hypothetical protein
MKSSIRDNPAVLADIFFSQSTLKALAAGNCPIQHDSITDSKTSDMLPDASHNACAFMAENQPFFPS